jgi:guanylate kinase
VGKERKRGRVVVISGPSGSGKTTICDRLGLDPRIRVAISATTRPPRGAEKDGVDYHFFTTQEFERLIAEGKLIEHAKVLDNYYGSLRAPMERAVEAGLCYVLNIDVQGGSAIKKLLPDSTFIFVVPPGEEELRRRLEKRGTDSPEDIRRRLELARKETEYGKYYDHVVVNDTVERAVDEIKKTIFGEK